MKMKLFMIKKIHMMAYLKLHTGFNDQLQHADVSNLHADLVTTVQTHYYPLLLNQHIKTCVPTN